MAEYPVNRAKLKLALGDVATLVLGQNTADMCDFLGQAGFDAMFIDGEHGPVNWGDLSGIARACELWDMAAIVRVHRNDPTLITRTLDQGVHGVVLPHVDTVEEAERAARAAKYGPEGIRGAAGNRRGYGVDDYHRRANEEVMVVVLIEDIVAIRHLDQIVKVDGIDAFSVAPGDLAQSMGHTGDIQHPEVQDTIDHAIATIVDAGRTAGTLVTDANVERYLDMGVKLINVAWQPWLLSGAAAFNEKLAARA